MAYFLKKVRQGNRTFISICESYYSKDKKGTAHRTYKSLGSIESNIEKGIDDPITYYQKEIDELNKSKKEDNVKEISDVTPEIYLGYFPYKAILNKMKVKKEVDYFKYGNDFKYDLYEILSTLTFARLVDPLSKYRTFYDVLPSIKEDVNYSYDQLLDGLDFIGNDYEKFIDIFNETLKNVYDVKTDKTYFDCTNFYFEIDKEDEFRRKGPSKENRSDPIVSMGLLLDANQIPIGMNLFPGNESEKPVLRKVIDDLKERNKIDGRTIHVADKGLNCGQNIAFSKENGDGYIFSKSVKQLSSVEKDWIFSKEVWTEVKDKDNNLLYRYKSCIDKFPYTFVYEDEKTTMSFTEKRVLTYNPLLAAKKKYEINKLVDKARGLCLSKAKKDEYGECSKYVDFKGSDGLKASASINQNKIDEDLKLAGYNLLVTSEINMSEKDIYDTYHNLWRIEESFRVMKSDLDARPVYLQKENTIKGHFLICYLSVLLLRLFQFKVLNNKYGTPEIIRFTRNFKFIEASPKYINISKSSSLIKDLSKLLDLPLTHYYLTERDFNKIKNFKFNNI